MPRPTVGIDLGIGRLGQRAVRLPAIGQRRRPVGRGAHQRMTEPHPRTQLDQPGGLGRRCGIPSDPELLGRAPQQGHVADRLGGRREQERLRRRRQRLETAH